MSRNGGAALGSPWSAELADGPAGVFAMSLRRLVPEQNGITHRSTPIAGRSLGFH